MTSSAVPAVALLLFSAISVFRPSASFPLEHFWAIRFNSFAEKFTKTLNGSTLPVLTASAYNPDEWFKILQDEIPESAEFPCHLHLEGGKKRSWRSKKRPTCVHELRPGDIDVIITMGDSLSAGAAAREPTPLGFFTDDRGVSFVGGGEKTWREFTTLPNILKEFNPKLYGYSTGKGTFFSDNAKLNGAISGSTDDELIAQAEYLLEKIIGDPNVDWVNDWKLINIFTGHNDICSYHCGNPENNSPDVHKQRLKDVVDLIHKIVPRAFVNIIGIIDPTINARYPRTQACDVLKMMFCPCLFGQTDLQQGILQMAAVVREYQKKEKELASSPDYKDREDFAVVHQPLFRALNGPKRAGDPEVRGFSKIFSPERPLWTPECFHLNQRGSALVARMLWNNMLEPVGNKSSTLEEFRRQTIKCPTKSKPYLFTAKNSEIYRKHSHQ